MPYHWNIHCLAIYHLMRASMCVCGYFLLVLVAEVFSVQCVVSMYKWMMSIWTAYTATAQRKHRPPYELLVWIRQYAMWHQNASDHRWMPTYKISRMSAVPFRVVRNIQMPLWTSEMGEKAAEKKKIISAWHFGSYCQVVWRPYRLVYSKTGLATWVEIAGNNRHKSYPIICNLFFFCSLVSLLYLSLSLPLCLHCCFLYSVWGRCWRCRSGWLIRWLVGCLVYITTGISVIS